MNDSTFCSKCGTENEPAYEYCKNCGAPLMRNQGGPQPPHGMPYPFSQPQNGPDPSYSSYTSQDGIPTEDLAFFIGKKANDILPRFMRMEISGSKISWCWPAAVLSFLFGPIGAAFWFLYRKMLKPAILLFSLGFLLSVLSALVTPKIDIDLSQGYYAALSSIPETLKSSTTLLYLIVSYLNRLLNLSCCVLTGLFGMYLYKKHCIATISAYRQSGIDMRFYKLGLASVGGTSAGFVVLGVFLYAVLSSLITFIFQLI